MTGFIQVYMSNFSRRPKKPDASDVLQDPLSLVQVSINDYIKKTSYKIAPAGSKYLD